jgi:hypothetical protein
MRKVLLLATGLAWFGLTGAAGAVTVTVTPGPQDPQYFATMAAGQNNFTLGDITWSLLSGSAATEKGTVPNQYTAPLGMGTDTTAGTTYMAVEGGGIEQATWATPQTGLTIYWGSIEDGNAIAVTIDGFTLTGADLVGSLGADSDSDDLVTITGLGPFTTMTFSSSVNAFEFSLGSGAVPTVPEPSTWALMLVGLSGLGVIGCRTSRRTAPTTA